MPKTILTDINQELEVIYVSRSERLLSRLSSRGNQSKWKSGDKFIKLNCLGYENIAEELVSWFLGFTDLDKSDYVQYKSCLIVEDGKHLGIGCYSLDFTSDCEEVTVKDLLSAGMKSFAITYDELREFLLDEIRLDIKAYIDRILCVDSITRNDDRHFDNIAFLYKDKIYWPAPIFDNGSSCMSDIISYPLTVDFNTNYKSIQAKPFRIDFKSQIGFVNRLYVDYEGFVNSVHFTAPEGIRAFEVIKRGLAEMEGISWERN